MFKRIIFRRELKKKEDFVQYLKNNEDIFEKRMMARLDVPVKVEFKICKDKGKNENELFCGITGNISQVGCLLLATKNIPLNSKLEISLLLKEGKDDKLILGGEILRLSKKEENLYEYGLSFFPMKKEERDKFSEFCFKRMYEMVGLNSPTQKERDC